jgi:Na+/proline symporter/nitrogen-specific signal transduction histidine kinase
VNPVVGVALSYVAALFALAWYVDRRAARGGGGWAGSPAIYTLSLSVYCTAWTFYGAVGSAARSGVEFMTIYLGPTLVFIGWWWLIRKLVRIGRIHRITSIADMLSSRYGKSGSLAAVASVMAVLAATPYIALQLQSVTLSYETITGSSPEQDPRVAFWAAAGLALFTILFGTRTLDENERHHGVVAAIAAEAVVKLAAVIAVGIFAVFTVAGGIGESFRGVTSESLRLDEAFGPRWMTLLFLSASAVICLPRQFQVTVVENSDESHLVTASWMFPLYMLLISLFVLPIAAVGAATFPQGANPDLLILALPLHHGSYALATLTFIGGLSAATSMVIVSTIALSTMVSNHIVAPLLLPSLAGRGVQRSGDVQTVLLATRRAAMVMILALGYVYFRVSGRSDALAATGLISFCGVAQFLPALIAGIFWRNATRAGAMAGLTSGFALWCYTLYLPSFGGAFILSAATIADGPYGIAALRPNALFGAAGSDALVHATAWSLGVNTAALVLVSLCTRQSPLERLQGTLFVDVFRSESSQTLGLVRRSAAGADLFILAQRILGATPAAALFRDAARLQGKQSSLPDPTPVFISRLERELAGSLGAASAHAMVGRIAGGETISMDELVEIADENARLMRATAALKAKSAEAEQSAGQLRAANARLLTIDAQKDEFLSRVSHELRTPMTSVRSFAEILRDNPDLSPEERRRFAAIIQAESVRLTRLIDEIHDLSFLERRGDEAAAAPVDPEPILTGALEIALMPFRDRRVELRQSRLVGAVHVRIDPDRLSQVVINLIANAVLHNDKDDVVITVSSHLEGSGTYAVDIEDNGPGIPPRIRTRIFEPFFRGSPAGSSGLGLTISARIITSFGGRLTAREARSGGARLALRLPTASQSQSCAPPVADTKRST